MQQSKVRHILVAWILILCDYSSSSSLSSSSSSSSSSLSSSSSSFFSPSSLSLTPSSPSSALLTLFHDMWHWRTQESPEFATQVGINDNTAGRLDSFSLLRFQKGKVHCEELLERANEIPSANLSFQDSIHLRVFKDQIGAYVDNFKYFKFFSPINSLEGPQLQLDHLISRQMILESYNDFQKLLSRYGEFPRQAEEIIALMKENIKHGFMPHNFSMEGVFAQFKSMDIPVVDSPFFKPFLQIPLSFPPEQRITLRQQAQERIEQDIIPSFAKLGQFLKNDYLTSLRPSPSIASLTTGSDYYQSLLRYYTSTVLTPQQIHSLGLNELKRLQEKILEVSIECGYSPNSTLSEILTDLRNSSEHYFGSTEDLLKAINSAIFDQIKPLLTKVVDKLPIDNLTVEGSNDERLMRGMAAWYEAPSLDGLRPAVLHIDTQHLGSIPQASIGPLSLHLSSPGHHLHAVFLQVSSSLPFFRKVIQTPRTGLAYLEFSPNPAFVEGWGLYSELRADEMGISGTPFQRLIRISRELSTTSRLVIDTGIHALDWTLENASKFLVENTALSYYSIKNELRRIVTWPALSCSAKVGEIRFKELRQKAENALGQSFDLLEFHRTLLECTSPLNIARDCVDQYVHEKIITLHEEHPAVEETFDGDTQTGSKVEERVTSGINSVNGGSKCIAVFVVLVSFGSSQLFLWSIVGYLITNR